MGIYRDGFAFDAEHVLQLQLSNKTNEFSSAGAYDFDFGSNPARSVGFNAGCYGTGTCGTSDLGRASMVIGWQRFDLIDNTLPTTANASGTALEGGVKSGTETIAFDAADTGAGVWGVQASLGSTTVKPFTPIDSNGGRCDLVDFDTGTPREFKWARPCPPSTSAFLTIDTRSVPDGEHLLTVVVFDAAGNAKTAVSRKITVKNAVAAPPTLETGAAAAPTLETGAASAPPFPQSGNAVSLKNPNGTGGSPGTGRVIGVPTRTIPTLFGRRLSLVGRVVDAIGTPIADASVDVFTTLNLPGSPRRYATTTKTNSKGTFSYAFSPKASQRVEFAYSARRSSTDYNDRATAEVPVLASISLALVREARRGSLVSFSGVIGVEPLPKTGAWVMIETKDGKRWRPSKLVRTTKRGNYAWTHRFKTRSAFTFRARLLAASDIPAIQNQTSDRTLRIR